MLGETSAWEGAFTAGQREEFTVGLKAVRPGDWAVTGRIVVPLDDGRHQDLWIRIYPSITETEAMVSASAPFFCGNCATPGPRQAVPQPRDSR